MDSAPFYASPRVQFRMGDLSRGECSASECSLIANDFATQGDHGLAGSVCGAGLISLSCLPQVTVASLSSLASSWPMTTCAQALRFHLSSQADQSPDGLPESLPDHSPVATQHHRHSDVRTNRWAPGEPADGPAGQPLVCVGFHPVQLRDEMLTLLHCVSSQVGPHDRLFVEEESDDIEWRTLPPYVWCHGW